MINSLLIFDDKRIKRQKSSPTIIIASRLAVIQLNADPHYNVLKRPNLLTYLLEADE